MQVWVAIVIELGLVLGVAAIARVARCSRGWIFTLRHGRHATLGPPARKSSVDPRLPRILARAAGLALATLALLLIVTGTAAASSSSHTQCPSLTVTTRGHRSCRKIAFPRSVTTTAAVKRVAALADQLPTRLGNRI